MHIHCSSSVPPYMREDPLMQMLNGTRTTVDPLCIKSLIRLHPVSAALPNRHGTRLGCPSHTEKFRFRPSKRYIMIPFTGNGFCMIISTW